MTTAVKQAPSVATTQVYRVFIKATPQAVWDAITKPEWTERYGYGGKVHYELRPGGRFHHGATPEMCKMGLPEQIVVGEVLEADPPRKLVQTWGPQFGPDIIAEGAKRLTWEIVDTGGGVTALTVTHELAGAPKTAFMVQGSTDLQRGMGGWSWVLSDLKTLLESGARM